MAPTRSSKAQLRQRSDLQPGTKTEKENNPESYVGPPKDSREGLAVRCPFRARVNNQLPQRCQPRTDQAINKQDEQKEKKNSLVAFHKNRKGLAVKVS